ncbi:Na+/H+ antiporter NhaA type [hydrothermal vent metagenome]|uniref:Na+/H+ antiporter NhaA type n=1 Tax=hydrothermal vent metagenome TaxID=652676 RepID=A0A1W1E9B3_9ZZZZ
MKTGCMHDIQDFIKKDSFPGLVLIAVTILALILQNSALSHYYMGFLHTPVEVRIGALHIAKPLLLWVNDGLMAIFFLLVGLEIKREVVEGHLSSLSQIALPGIAAVGGMAVPALVYITFNKGDAFAMQGWAIPTATDIAFALGILSLLGKRVPMSLKIFLMALAIIDDLGAIVIIALFYTQELSPLSILVAAASLVVLFIMNRMGVVRKAAYMIVGVILWVSVLKSGVHATLAGVALAFFIPLKSTDSEGKTFSIAHQLEHGLHYWVALLILPLFAFVNAGVDLSGISLGGMKESVPLGIMAGLFIGKQLGVFTFSFIAIKTGIAKLPKESTWLQLYGVALLTGIGFTMSLFVDTLTFNDTDLFAYGDKLAILLGSLFSGVAGYSVLKIATKKSVP